MSLSPPNRLLLSQLTPVQIKPQITIACKNPFYSTTFFPFPSATGCRLSLSLSEFFDSKSKKFFFLKNLVRRKVSKDWKIRSESVSRERGREGEWRGMCFKRNVCTSVLQGETTGRVDTETEKVSVGQTAASPFLLSPSSSTRPSSPPSQDILTRIKQGD